MPSWALETVVNGFCGRVCDRGARVYLKRVVVDYGLWLQLGDCWVGVVDVVGLVDGRDVLRVDFVVFDWRWKMTIFALNWRDIRVFVLKRARSYVPWGVVCCMVRN